MFTGIRVLKVRMALGILVASILCPHIHAQVSDSETVLAVAVHVSEYTKNAGLLLSRGSGQDYPWRYYQIYSLLEEALRSDGTPFVEIGDAQIEAGGLLTSRGNPKYPILISLAAECVSDTEAAAIRSYVSAGGFCYVGSSSFSRQQDGQTRPTFALSAEMGVASISSGESNWAMIGEVGARIQRVANHRLVDHLLSGTYVRWALPASFYDVMKCYSNGYGSDAGHQAWRTSITTATPLVVIEGSGSPLLAVRNSGSGWYIYHSELAPLAGWGEGNVVLQEYAFFNKAIDWAFETRGFPLSRVSAWPYPYQSAFVLRHDDIGAPPLTTVMAEEARGFSGQYFIITDWCSDAEMPGALAQAASRGAIAGGHGYQHHAPDLEGYSLTLSQIDLCLDDLQAWTGHRPRIWVSPFFGAILDSSFQAIEDSGVIASGGEQSIGPFPHFALSMTQENRHYSFVEIPTTFWIRPDMDNLLSANDGIWGVADIRGAVDCVYGLGGLISLYDHLRSDASLLYYLDYVRTKPWVWATDSESIATWWDSRRAVHVNPQYSESGGISTLTLTIAGTLNPSLALDLRIPDDVAVRVSIDGSPTSHFRQSGRSVKIQSGMANSIVVSWGAESANNPPVAVGDAYLTSTGSVMTIAAPGVLGNDTDPDGDSLTAGLASMVMHGSLTLAGDGSFIYAPALGYSGTDSFTYTASDGRGGSSLATVTITVNAAANRAPVARNDAYTVVGSTTLTIISPGVLGNDTDADGDALTAVLATNVAHGTLALASNGSFNYTPMTGYAGSDTFTYTASDGRDGSSLATVTITVSQVSTVGVFGLSSGNNSYNESANTLDAMRFQNSVSTGTLTTLEVLIDGTAVSGNIRLGIYADNNGSPGSLLLDAGEAVVSNGWVSRTGLSLPVTLNAYYWLVYVLQNANIVRYQGSYGAGAHRWVSYSFGALPTSFPSGGYSNPNCYVMRATVRGGALNAPLAQNDAYTVVGSTTLTVASPGVLGNDTDADGDALTAVLATNVAHGTLALASNGSFSYTPTTGYTGSDTFTYTASDGRLRSDAVTVTITVSGSEAMFGLISGNASWNENANILDAMRFQNMAGSGRLTKIEVLFNASAMGAVRLGIYADNNGRPGTLLVDAGSVPISRGWVSLSGLNLPVSQGAYYWLAFDMQNSASVVYQSSQAPSSHHWMRVAYGALPAGFSSSGSNNNCYVMRATVQLSGS